MDAAELMETHSIYSENIRDWMFWGLSYSGGTKLIEFALQRHMRESQANWRKRQEEGICFNYSSIVIDLFNFYLTEKPALRELGDLSNDPIFKMFQKDADLYGTNFDVYLNESQKLAAIYGAAGVLIDKPNSNNSVLKEDIRDGIYPYCSTFTLPNILDWKHERHPKTNRPMLTYLKLFDYDDRYLLWWPDKWEIWVIPEGGPKSGFRIHKHTDTSDYTPKPGENKWAAEPGKPYSALMPDEEPLMIAEGPNPLNEIPFLWFQNIKNIEDPYIGESDIKEISRISSSIIRDVSYGEEVIKFAGFPQARRPMAREGEEINNEAGVTAILEFDPTMPDSKPDWLESAVLEPVTAILNWIDKKIVQTFQLAHLAGSNAQKTSDSVRSGVALRYQYQQLGLVLGKKSENLTETELGILKYWLKWQGKEKEFDNIKIVRSTEFSIDDLSQSLENAIMADRLIPEVGFKRELMKTVAKKVLPDVADETMVKIHEAIDNLSEDKIFAASNPTENRSTKDIRQNTADSRDPKARIIGTTADASVKGMINNIKGSSRQLDGRDGRGENPDR